MDINWDSNLSFKYQKCLLSSPMVLLLARSLDLLVPTAVTLLMNSPQCHVRPWTFTNLRRAPNKGSPRKLEDVL